MILCLRLASYAAQAGLFKARRFGANSGSTVDLIRCVKGRPRLHWVLLSNSARVCFETWPYPTRLANVITEATLSPQ